MRYYLIAGERSGDLHASNLMKALLKDDQNSEFRYFGGDYMKAVGGELVVHYEQLAFMGFWEVLTNLRTISGYLKKCKEDILRWQPDKIILIDYAGFNLRIAKWAKKQGIEVVYYISPKIWAWNQSRAYKIKSTVDQMFVILPFEVEFYKKFDFDVTYVGNPVIQAINEHTVNENFKKEHQLEDKEIIAILPGSRKQEVKKVLPLVQEIFAKFPEYHFCLGAVGTLNSNLYDSVREISNVTIVVDETYDLLAHSTGAIVCSGTATLETAIWKVPQVVVYKTSQLSYIIAKALIKVDYISLVNLIAGKEVVKELIQREAVPEKISKELEAALNNQDQSQIILDRLGNLNASAEVAKRISVN